MKIKQIQKNIPNGWKEEVLQNFGVGVIDGDRGKNYPSNEELYSDNFCLFLSATNVSKNGFKFTDNKFISQEKDSLMNNGKLIKGDIVITTRGTIGNIALYSMNVPFEHIRINSGMAIIRNSNKSFKTEFLWNYLKSSKFLKEIKRVSFGSAQPQLTIQIIKKFSLLAPEKEEQRRIAKVLEMWNEAMEKLVRKIGIKKNIKKGLMQRLLTGATRLPGFDGEWENSKLSNLCNISTGKKDVNEGNPNGIYPFFTCAQDHTYSDNYSYDTEAILIAGNADVGHCKYYKGKFEAYQRTYILSEFKDTQPNFLFIFLSHFFKTYVESLKQIGAMSYIKLPMLAGFLVKTPDIKEQKAIANILTTADNEIEQLTKKLAFLRDQKKYLLNNLITGKIRTPETLSITK